MGEQVPSIGRVVHYRLDVGPHAGDCRPALIVRVWGEGPDALVNLQVLTDGGNDEDEYASGIVWRTSVHRNTDNEPGSWHWPEYVPAKEAS